MHMHTKQYACIYIYMIAAISLDQSRARIFYRDHPNDALCTKEFVVPLQSRVTEQSLPNPILHGTRAGREGTLRNPIDENIVNQIPGKQSRGNLCLLCQEYLVLQARQLKVRATSSRALSTS